MKPLGCYRIIDVTVAVAGPVATHLLGDLGADVIRVEPPFARPTRHLDVAPRVNGVPDRPYNRLVGYNDLQRSKRGITLDLSKAAGRDVMLQLVAASDALVENMAPRVLPGLGLSFEELQQANERIVLVSMPAFGATGPFRDRVSFGPGIDAMSGLAHLTGYPDRGPMNASLYYCDYNAGTLAALATLAALRHRDRTGHGQHVEVAMIDGELQLVADALLDVQMNARTRRRSGNAHPSMSPHGVYRCADDDRWIAIAIESDAQWSTLAAIIGTANDERFLDVVGRVRHRAEVDAIVERWTVTRESAGAADMLRAAGVPASPVQTDDDVLDDPLLRRRDWLQRVRHPEAGDIPHTRIGFTADPEPVRITRAAPRFGEHNDEVLRSLAGITAHEMRALEARHVVAYEPPAARE
jgi:crotonobetainyl-CoA:carnitine CoA-transferase CaiB-like acyl-CoA transferase